MGMASHVKESLLPREARESICQMTSRFSATRAGLAVSAVLPFGYRRSRTLVNMGLPPHTPLTYSYKVARGGAVYASICLLAN